VMWYKRVLTLVVLISLLSTSAARAEDPKVGASGIGDPLFPRLGNGGYDVKHYTLDLSANMDDGTVSATATIAAQATDDLSSFNLDLEGLEVSRIIVNGTPADYSRDDHELTVKPARSLQKGQDFTTEIAYHGEPGAGWRKYDKGVFVASEPDGAAGWFPVNDHPLDKATYTFRITVPKPFVAAANGLLKDTVDQGSTRTYLWEESKPMASYLATVNVSTFKVQTDTGPGGLPIRNYFPADIKPEEIQQYTRTSQMIEFFSSIYGPYPFEAYGVAVADTSLGFALETQTLSLFGRKSTSRRSPQIPSEEVVAHELAHQWYGDSVSLKHWQDIWLNEGFATYSQFLWAEHIEGQQGIDSRIRNIYEASVVTERSTKGTTGRPTADGLFDTELIYLRGALTLHALRLQVGDDAFFRILRTYADRFRYGNAETSDFIAVAEEISKQDLKVLFNSWLYETKLPDIPEMKLYRANIESS
jgi:aminopeptidase N